MAKIIDNESKDHKLTVLDDFGKIKIVIVGTGPRAYLWIGSDEKGCLSLVEGRKVLRELAKKGFATHSHFETHS